MKLIEQGIQEFKDASKSENNQKWDIFLLFTVWLYEWMVFVSSDGLVTSPGWSSHSNILSTELHLGKVRVSRKWMNILVNLSGIRLRAVEVWAQQQLSSALQLNIYLVHLNPKPAFFFFFFEAEVATLVRILHKKSHFKLVWPSFTYTA